MKNDSITKCLDCIYCGDEFTKNNKPLILKCSHNLCQVCHRLNKNKIICLECNCRYELREIRRCPINFLLLEIIERSHVVKEENKPVKEEKKQKKNRKDSKGSNSKKNETKKSKNSNLYNCKECKLLFPNKFHLTNFPTHELEVSNQEESELGQPRLINKSLELMEKYKLYNEKLDKAHENFFDYFIERSGARQNEIIKELKQNDLLDNFLIFGIINKSDKERIKEFQKYLSNHKLSEAIISSYSYDELLLKLSNNFSKEIKIHQFMNAYFYYIEICNKKLNKTNIESCLDKLNTKIYLNNDEESKNLFKLFSQDLNVLVYNAISLENDVNNNIWQPHLITEEGNLIIFDTLTESIKKFKIKEFFLENFKELENYSYFLHFNYNLFITGGQLSNSTISNTFSVNIITGERKNYKNMNESKHKHSSIIFNNQLYVLGGNYSNNDGDNSTNQCRSFEKLNITEDTWTKLSPCPHDFKNKPTFLIFEEDFYVFDNLFHFYFYNIKTDHWTICKPNYKGSYNLQLKDFIAISVNHSNIIILGGVNDNNTLNNQLYFFKDCECTINVKGEFKMTSESSIIKHGFVLNEHYLLEYNQKDKLVNVYNTKDLMTFKWNKLLSVSEEL